MISVGSEVQVLPGPPWFRAARHGRPVGERAIGAALAVYRVSPLAALSVLALTEERGLSSAGRAPALQAGGQRFEPASLHSKAGYAGGEAPDFPHTRFLAGPLAWSGMFFETVNRIWRTNCPPQRDPGDGVGWGDGLSDVCVNWLRQMSAGADRAYGPGRRGERSLARFGPARGRRWDGSRAR